MKMKIKLTAEEIKKKKEEMEEYRKKYCIEIPVPTGQRKVYVDVGKDKEEAEKALPEMMNEIALRLLKEEDDKAKKENKDGKSIKKEQ